jgi:hypothetical protein
MHRVRVYAATPTPVTIATDPQVIRSVVPLCERLRMTSTALRAWRSQRADRLDRLVSAHATGMDRVTGEHLDRVFDAMGW